MPFWTAVALCNMALAVFLTADPQRATDFETVWRWTRGWLIEGRNLYASRLSGTDYPPHAILALSPISLLPLGVAIRAWTALNLLLVIAAPYLAVRMVKPQASKREIACVAILFLGWAGSRTLLQFTLLTLVFGLAAVILAKRRPAWAGGCLALSMMKPQIGLPFLLWVLCARRWKVAATCAAGVAAGSLLWCVRAGADPLNVAVRYVQILRLYYVGNSGLTGVSELTPLVARLAPAFAVPLTGLLSIGLLAMILVAAWRCRGSRLLYPVPAMAGVWSLLTFYHLTYGFVLLLPAAALLLLTDDARSQRARATLFWTMQIGLAVDLPGIWRRLASREAVAVLPIAVLQDFYRVLLLGVFFSLWAIHRRLRAVDDNCMTRM